MIRRHPEIIRFLRIIVLLFLAAALARQVFPVFAGQAEQADPTPARRTAAPITPTLVTPTETTTPTISPTITRTPAVSYTPTSTRTTTPLPPEYLETEFQTSGLLTGAVMLLLIILGGTLVGIRRQQ